MAFEIIDFHTHPFNKKSGNFCFYEGSVNSEEDFIFDLEKSGISRFCGSVIDKEKRDFSGVLEGNRIALELSKKYGKKYIPGIHIHPDFVDESEKEIEAAYSEGVRLIGELVPYHHGWKYDHPRLGELMECLDGKDMVISIHSTDSDLAFLEKMAESNPEKTFVFAHPGDIPRVKGHIDIMKRRENVYLDLSGTGLFRYGVLKHLCDSVGAERILFGTDYPICNPEMYVKAVLFEKISDREKELVLSANAKRLLNL